MGEGGVEEERVQDAEEEDEDWDADCCLCRLVSKRTGFLFMVGGGVRLLLG